MKHTADIGALLHFLLRLHMELISYTYKLYDFQYTTSPPKPH